MTIAVNDHIATELAGKPPSAAVFVTTGKWFSYQLILLLVLTMLPAIALTAAEPPPGCKKFKTFHYRSVGSPWFMEHWSDTEWKLGFPNPRFKRTDKNGPPHLMDGIDIDEALSSPSLTGGQILTAIDRHLCKPRPAGLELEWQSFLQKDVGGTGRAWLSVSGTQTIDGIPTQGRYCQANYSRRGSLLDLNCSLLRPESVRVPRADWPTDEEARVLAEQAYLADLRNLPGPGQNTRTVNYRYRASGPVIQVQHTGCGSTQVDVSTRQARYYCPSDLPGRPRHGVGSPPARLVMVDDLIPGFWPEQIAVGDDGNAVLVLGQARGTRPATGYGDSGPASNTLLYLIAQGEVQWQRVPRPAEQSWLRIQDGQALLIQLLSNKGKGKTIRSELLHLATGEVLSAPVEFSLPHHFRLLPDAQGERLYVLDDNQPGSLKLSSLGREGQPHWRISLARRAITDMVYTPDGDLLLLDLREVAGEDVAGLTLISQKGEVIREIRLSERDLGFAQLIGLHEGKVYLNLHSSLDGGKQARRLVVVDIASAAVDRRFPPLPGGGDVLLRDGSVLAYGGDAGWALAAANSGPQPWRRYFGFGGHQTFTAATALGTGGVVLAASLTEPVDRIDTPGSFALLWLDSATSELQRNADDCPFVSEEALRGKELELWQQYNIYVLPELYDYAPELDCIDRHRAAYRQFLDDLLAALEQHQYRAPGFFVYLRAEPGQRGVRLEGGWLGRSPARHRGGSSYKMRAHFSDPIVLADFLSNGLRPHVNTVSRLRQEFARHVGSPVSLAYSHQTASEGPAITGGHTLPTLVSMERELATLMRLSEALPTAEYPDFAGLASTQTLVLEPKGLVIPRPRGSASEPPFALNALDAIVLRDQLRDLEAQQWAMQQKSCRDGFAGRDRWGQLLLAATCNMPERIENLLSGGDLPQNDDVPIPHQAPLLHNVHASPDVFDRLVAAGADLYAQDIFGHTALHAAMDAGARKMIAHLAKDRRLVNLSAHDGNTALHRAAFTPRYPAELLAPLVRNARDINARNLDGETVLHRAGHSPGLVRDLLESGASVHLVDRNQRTPLHRAAMSWLAEESIALLLAAGADPAALDKDGLTPLDLARKSRLTANAQALQPGEAE